MKAKWQIKKLVEVTDLITCGVAKRPDYVDTGIPFLSAKNVKNGQIIWNDYRYVSEKTHEQLTKNNKPRKGDILYTRVGSFGEAAILEKDTEFSIFVSLTLIRTKDEILNSFLKHYLNSHTVKTLAKNSVSGSGVGNLNVGTVREFLIPIPPLSEQKRIVSIVDQAFEGIDRAIANTKKNLANAHELFESYLNAIFTQEGNSWVEKKLGKLASKIGSGATPRGGQNSYQTEGISLIRSLNVHDRRFKEKDLAFLDDKQAEKLANVIVEEGDVLLNITGASIARSCISPTEHLPARVNQHVAIIRPDPSQISYRFLNYLITSRPYKEKLLFTGDKAGATRQALTKAQIQDFSIHFPSLCEQGIIITKLDLLEVETHRLEAIYRRKLAALNELKQAILQKAFTGELTADNANQATKAAKEVIAA